MNGTIKVFNKSRGYGFIGIDGENDVFFHISAIQDRTEPMIGTQVEFEIVETDRGFSAKEIKIVE